MTRAFMKLGAPLLLALAALGGKGLAAQDSIPPHETFTIESSALGETRRINVYTPPGYAGRARYPVLYLLDGGVEEDFPHVAATVDAAIRARQLRAMILVGIENTERRRDLTGPTEVEEDRRIAPRVGGSAAFRRFIRDELMRAVRGRYQVSEEAAIMGESLAGLFVVETFLLEPMLFDTYIAISPSLWWNDEHLVRAAGGRIREHQYGRGNRVVYLASADEENIAPAAARLAEVLRQNEVPVLRWRYDPRPDLAHGTIYRALVPQVLRDLFRPTLAVSSMVARGRDGRINDAGWPATPLQRGAEATREPAGRFTLLHQEFRAADPSTYPPRPEREIRLHLSHDAPDGRVNVSLTDNGMGLSAIARAPGCTVWVRYLQYAHDGDDRHLFAAMLAGVRTLVELCAEGLENPAAYPRLLEDAEPDFAAAIQAMRARAASLFGARTERCNPPEPFEWVGVSHYSDPCGEF